MVQYSWEGDPETAVSLRKWRLKDAHRKRTYRNNRRQPWRALTEQAAAGGHEVLAIARSFGPAPYADRVTLLKADLASREGIETVIQHVVALGVPVRALINNAGIQNPLDLTTAHGRRPMRSSWRSAST
jgi:NAD(P)-dependent dehydrogenase (short-subunit alcohol dehydrogenase family)